MRLTEEQKKEFDTVVYPVIKWLNEKTHPHTTIIIDTTHAELTEGVAAFSTEDFIDINKVSTTSKQGKAFSEDKKQWVDSPLFYNVGGGMQLRKFNKMI